MLAPSVRRTCVFVFALELLVVPHIGETSLEARGQGMDNTVAGQRRRERRRMDLENGSREGVR